MKLAGARFGDYAVEIAAGQVVKCPGSLVETIARATAASSRPMTIVRDISSG
jgi:hypothetical protein